MKNKQPKIKWYRNAYYVFYYAKDGKRVKTSLGKDRIKAHFTFQEVFCSNTNITVPTTTEDPGKPFSEAVDMFYLSRYGVKQIWNTGYPSHIRTNPASGLGFLRMLQRFGSIQNVNEITTEMVNRFINNLLTTKGAKSYSRGPKTANRYLTFYRAFLQYCAANRWLKSNPADKMLIPNMKETTPEPHNFSDEEYQMILDNGGQYIRFFQFMYETAIRSTDTYFLTKKDFYVKGDRMYVKIFTNKTGKLLNVPISKVAQDIVEKVKGTPIFPMFKSNHCKNDSMKVLKRCFNGNAQGYGARFCNTHNIVMHSFRHTFAMRKLANGVPMETIGQLMGHSFTRMTELYARYQPDTNLLKWV